MEQFLFENQWLILLIIAWTLPWKAMGLWKAAKKSQKWWFIAILVINSLAILPILYIFVFSKKKPKLITEEK